MSAPVIPIRSSAPDDAESVFAAASDYAARGWPVFPCNGIAGDGACTCGAADCSSPGKHPTTARGVKDATTDPATIGKWTWRGRNIGLATGGGLFVVDVDTRHGAVLERTETDSWLLVDGYGNHVAELPPSRVHRTGSGGWHWFGSVNERIGNSSGKLGRGIDTKADGGYVIAPPSRHVSGGSYAVLEAGDLADVPESLLVLLRRPAPAGISDVTRSRKPPRSYGARALVEEVNKVRGAAEGTRNEQLNRSALKLGKHVGADLLDRAVVESELLRAALTAGLGEVEARATIRSGVEAGIKQPRQVEDRPRPSAPPRVHTRQPLLVDDAVMNEALREVAKVLRERVFIRDTMPVFVEHLDDETKVGGLTFHSGGTRLRPATAARVGYEVDEHFACVKSDGRTATGSKPCAFPKAHAERFVAAATALSLRSIDGVARGPVIDFETGVLSPRGYADRHKLWIDFDPGILPPIPAHPTLREAADALERLLNPWREFIRTFQADRVGVASAVLTAVARPALFASPAILMSGSGPGVGKGLFVDCLSLLATGAHPATVAEGSDDNEFSKRVDAAKLSGAPVVSFDNMTREVGADGGLLSGLTNPNQTVRLMRTQEAQTVVWRSLVCLTSNNPKQHGDSHRRVIPIRLIAPNEAPERIDFGFDPKKEVLADRPHLLADALTILRWRIQNRHDNPAETLGSFPEWAEIVGGAVEMLEGRSPVSLMSEAKEADPRLSAARQLLEVLHKRHQGKAFTSSQAIQQVFDAQTNDEIREMVSVLTGAPLDRVTPHAFGLWLSRNRDSTFGNLKIVAARGRSGVARWCIVPANDPA